MIEFGINAKVIEKKYNYATYIKEAEAIALFLNIIGAHNSLLNFENIKVTHEMNNQINRMVNCETANLSKIVNTAIRQIEAINKIKRTIGLNNLPDNLKEIAKAASFALKYGGRLCMLHRADRLAEVCYTLHEAKLEVKKIQFVGGRYGAKPYLVMVEAVKGGKPNVEILETIYNIK
jgi:hypothetical protein